MSTTTARTESGWIRFWNQGTWWKAVLLVVVYWLVYQGIALITSTVFASSIDTSDLFGTPQSIFVAMALPILLAGLLLVLFMRSVGWLGDSFARQPRSARPWMWVAVVLVLIPNAMRLFGTEWSQWTITQVLTILFLGLCIGFAEELLTRGAVVTMLRRGGYGQRAVMVLSAFLFAILHSGNAITGEGGAAVIFTVVYTFGFGVLMYLSMVVTGRLIWAILLHASTDPTTMLVISGVDGHGHTVGHPDGLVSIAGLFNFVYVAFAVLAIFLVKKHSDAKNVSSGSH
ncbi:CPBP family intramembrane glutamic endopeptidase [Microbacterium sp. 3J1]|uniref:CPBP family intramembrane glutamic endopeptidase n=1 Tax=Microbacterium sp. 3J1 TaxID=861269 RepID=UPI000A781CF3|nr:CPBP family intramembrane glutamic endopeptidase [Microbacterium sp. 3J1]